MSSELAQTYRLRADVMDAEETLAYHRARFSRKVFMANMAHSFRNDVARRADREPLPPIIDTMVEKMDQEVEAAEERIESTEQRLTKAREQLLDWVEAHPHVRSL